MKPEAGAEYGEAPMAHEATALMLAAKQGDPAAFGTLVERVRGRAFRLAFSLVGSRDDAMELTQDAFLKVYKARATFREGEAFLPWFHRILRNTCFSFLRSQGRLKPRSVSARAPGADEDDADYDIEDRAEDVDARLIADERTHAFRAAFQKLSARDREILVLRHFHESSYKEIASTLSIPEGTVMSRLFHARRRLRDVLGKGFGEDVGAEEDGGGDA
jgi:RNA polymerase sigma-70 factor (ECF subfamily)